MTKKKRRLFESGLKIKEWKAGAWSRVGKRLVVWCAETGRLVFS